MGDNDEYARGFYDAVTPEWTAFTFDEGRRLAIFCHVFGVRYQRTLLTEFLAEWPVETWQSFQISMVMECARVLARAL